MMGLWRGTNPAAARAALLTASQCVTYDVVKNSICYYTAAEDSLPVQVATGTPLSAAFCFPCKVSASADLVVHSGWAVLSRLHVATLPVKVTGVGHACAGAITGVVTTTVTAPADVLKTRMFAGGSGGVVQAATTLVAEEGVGALFKGWMANYVRLGPQTMIIFLVSEQLRRAFGLGAL